MGMDYKYVGSCSYPRFDRELCAIAAVFGGQKTEHLAKRFETESERPLDYWFGSYSSDSSNEPKFVFPEGTNETLAEWFNNIYKFFNEKKTEIICDQILSHPEIEEISPQMWSEIQNLKRFNDCWNII